MLSVAVDSSAVVATLVSTYPFGVRSFVSIGVVLLCGRTEYVFSPVIV